MKILSLFLAFSLLVSSCPLSAQALRPRRDVKADMDLKDNVYMQYLEKNFPQQAEEIKRANERVQYHQLPTPPMVVEMTEIHRFINQCGGYYNAYSEALARNPDVPELNWPAEKVSARIKTEADKLVKTINDNAWKKGGEKRKEAIDVALDILATVFFMGVAGKISHGVGTRSTNKYVLKNYGRLGGLTSFSTKGGSWLSRFLLGGPWKGYGRVWLRQFVLDLTIFTLVMEPLMSAYHRLMPRFASTKYLEGMRFSFKQVDALLMSWDLLNQASPDGAILLDYDGQQVQTGEPDELGWYNEDAKHNHIVLLYALRYLNHYASYSKDKWRDQLVLLELLNLSLPYGAMYESINNVTLTGNPGRLFFDYEREEIIRALDFVEESEEIASRVALLCYDKRHDEYDYSACMRKYYFQEKYMFVDANGNYYGIM